MDITEVLVLFCLVSAIITYGLGIAVFTRNPGSPVHRLFLLTMLAASYWSAGEFLIWQADSSDDVRFWLKASAFWTLAIVLAVHFILAFTRHPLAGRQNLKYLLVLLYLPAVAVSLAEIFTESIYTVIPGGGPGAVYTPVIDSPAYMAQSAFFVMVMAFALYIGISSWLKQAPGRVRQQNMLICIGILIVILSGAMSAFVLPSIGLNVPNTVFIGIVCFSGLISYAMIWQGLFTVSPETAAANIIRLMPDGLILTESTGHVITANTSAEALFEIRRDDLAGMSLETLLPRESAVAIGDALRVEGTVTDFEAVLGTPEYRVVSISGTLIRDPDGVPAGSVLIVRDITGRKTTERTLRLAKEKLSLISRLTRHDITNLVTALNGYVLLIDEKISDPEAREYIAACTGILEKIEGQLQFSREYEEIGKHEPLWQSLESMVAKAKESLHSSRAKISIDVPPISVYADPISVKVVYNLLENALRHGGDGLTRIDVTAQERDGGELVIAFEDDGDGVPAEQKELIFAHGYGKNTGLGLTISREILALTDIGLIETGTPGKGARFEMHVPRQSWRKE